MTVPRRPSSASCASLPTRAASRMLGLLACGGICVGMLSVAISCASSKRGTSTTKRQSASARYGRLTTTLGLELVRWFVTSDPKIRRRALEELVSSGEATRIPSPLAREGIVFLRVKTASLPTIAAAFEKPLEGARQTSRATRRTLLGQAEAFTDLATVEVAQGSAFFSDGRAVRSDEGLLRLAMRGWCFPTVDSAAARLEFRLGVTPNRLVGVPMDPSEARERMTDIAGARLALELTADECLVILEEPFVPPEPEEGADPPALPPPTRAALLFEGRPFPDRALILVIEPKFADILPSSKAVDPTASPTDRASDGALLPTDEVSPEPVPESAPDPAPASSPDPAPESESMP